MDIFHKQLLKNVYTFNTELYILHLLNCLHMLKVKMSDILTQKTNLNQ